MLKLEKVERKNRLDVCLFGAESGHHKSEDDLGARAVYIEWLVASFGEKLIGKCYDPPVSFHSWCDKGCPTAASVPEPVQDRSTRVRSCEDCGELVTYTACTKRFCESCRLRRQRENKAAFVARRKAQGVV